MIIITTIIIIIESRHRGKDEGIEWACTLVSATVQLLLASCARHHNHYLQDNARSNEPITAAGPVPITLNPHCQASVKALIMPKEICYNRK